MLYGYLHISQKVVFEDDNHFSMQLACAKPKVPAQTQGEINSSCVSSKKKNKIKITSINIPICCMHFFFSYFELPSWHILQSGPELDSLWWVMWGDGEHIGVPDWRFLMNDGELTDNTTCKNKETESHWPLSSDLILLSLEITDWLKQKAEVNTEIKRQNWN